MGYTHDTHIHRHSFHSYYEAALSNSAHGFYNNILHTPPNPLETARAPEPQQLYIQHTLPAPLSIFRPLQHPIDTSPAYLQGGWVSGGRPGRSAIKPYDAGPVSMGRPCRVLRLGEQVVDVRVPRHSLALWV